MAIDEMVVDHAGRLHEGVDDRRPDEARAARLEVLGDRLRDVGLGRNLARRFALAVDRLAVDEAPQMLGEPALRGAARASPAPARSSPRSCRGGARCRDRRAAPRPWRVVARDFLRVETVEGGAEGGALAQDGDPRQAGLEAVERELLEQGAIVPFRDAPLLVVIGEIERVDPRPRAAMQARRRGRRPRGRADGRFQPCRFIAARSRAVSPRRRRAESKSSTKLTLLKDASREPRRAAVKC